MLKIGTVVIAKVKSEKGFMCESNRKALSNCRNTIRNRRLLASTAASVDISINRERAVAYILAYLNIGRLQGRDIARIIRELLRERDDAEEE